MKTLRWITWQLIMIPVNGLFVLAAAIMVVFSLMLPVARLLRFAAKRKRGERLAWHELLSIPEMGARFFLFSLQSAWSTHRVRVGEV